MALTGEEIRARLSAFAARWSVYEGTERSEAQTFLNELFACYGTDRSEVARLEHAQAGRFLDLIWPRVCLIEMKAPKEAKKLSQHRAQAMDYWRDAAEPDKNVPSPRWVVICAFRRLEIWEPGAYPKEPRLVLDLIDLPDQYDALLFLAEKDPVFAGGQAALTREAVVHLVDLYERLKERRAADPDVLRDFILQCVWCMFAEDLGQVPEHRFTAIVDDLIANSQRSSADDLGGLFAALNDKADSAHGMYAGVPYANGGLFENAARVHLEPDELEHLREAAAFQWNQVQPSIFGSLLEGGLGHDKQWALGAHYTHEADIQKVVQPTIVEPWRERIESLKTHKEAVAAQNDLLNYVVLDPACGSGNFLYVAYRELRRLEKQLHEREVELRKKAGLKDQGSLSLHFPLQNMRGIEIDGFAVALARVTLWMGHKLAVDELELDESTLPLADLSGIKIGDALRIDWPRADAIIGNPPFLGDRFIRRLKGAPYVEWLKNEFGVGVKDYCVYWFRRAHQHLDADKRAGLVGTNSIAQNRARAAGLDFILANGGVITSAVATQDWPGEAAVDVSIVNWVRDPQQIPTAMLDGRQVVSISSSLTAGDDPRGKRLPTNGGRAFQGFVPGANYFADPSAAKRLLEDAPRYGDVIRPFLSGDDIANDPEQLPSRFIVDFGLRSLEAAMEYPEALRLVELQTRLARESSTSYSRNPQWWQFLWPRPVFREAASGLSRFVVGTRVGKRILFTWAASHVVPSDGTNMFVFDDDGSFGVLSSRIHTEWARTQSSTLEDRIRYTPSSAFETFPWPTANLTAVGVAGAALVERRRQVCVERTIGLTGLYNQIDDGAWTDIADLHVELDEAVAAAYGWPTSVAHDPGESNRRLLELNRAIAAGEVDYRPFG
ncbi:MAG TPA: DNA methyltransferase [Gaiellaceae bacterium]